ncbi:MAG: YfhO family protein, partial [Bacteroidota bacterium]|nr:YfhO family protein [Bacteroidota bacterium]
SGLYDFTSENDGQLKQAGLNMDLMYDLRKDILRADTIRSLLFLALAAGVFWFYIRQKVSKNLMLGILGVLILFDLWGVGKRYLGPSEFKSKTAKANIFTPRPVDQEILKDSDPNYRVFDLSINTFNSAITSYFHKTIGGYSPAKLRRYQDLIDFHIAKNNIAVLNMLNTKYVITREGQAQQNPGALGHAWFVSTVKKVTSPDAEIQALQNFNPQEEAVFLENEFPNYVTTTSFTKNGTIQLTDYKPNHLQYQSSSSSEQLAVFSEIWYGPDKGWDAYIDGALVKHIRVNYALRAIKIPAGQHKIEFKFQPHKVYMARSVTYYSSLITLLLLVGGLIWYFRKKKNSDSPIIQDII